MAAALLSVVHRVINGRVGTGRSTTGRRGRPYRAVPGPGDRARVPAHQDRVGWLLRVNRLYGPSDRWLRTADFAEAFQGGCWAEHTSIYQISRWETAAVCAPYLAIRRYEELLELPSHRLVALVDTIHRYAASTEHVLPTLARSPDRIADSERLDELVERAASSTDLLTGVEWDELTRRLAAAPAVVITPHRAWSDIAERLLSETIVADGIAWMQRYEALSRLLAHPVGQQAAVAACAGLAADRTNQVFVETVSVLDASDHPDANRHVLQQLIHPTNERTQYGALLASVRKLRFGHFTDAEMPRLMAVIQELTLDSNRRDDIQQLATELMRRLLDTASAASRTKLRGLVTDPAGPDHVLRAGRLAGQEASQRLVARLASTVVAQMPRDVPRFRDDVLPVVLEEMLFNPVFDVRLLAAITISGTPYRRPLAAALAADLTGPAVLGASVAPAMIEALRLLGGAEQRPVIERLITASGLPARVTVASAQAIGHVGGTSTDRFWRQAITHHAQLWRGTRQPTNAAALSGLTYGLGMTRNRAVLQRLRNDDRMPEPVRTAAAWWLNLSTVVYEGANR
ncbi:hypothetical protein MRQ36_27635 [Micromonospora sp. R77]|uniref:hypothetical protein n=1 Tax=Micromonospora sp. R77 TaxID=2925836 RepID=UPI001F622D41|nr:hypothetical protein [Micromonospora sp. R77]MCI4066116.1 hypothetical protein [Micromonospora sp. R77]